VCLTVALRVTTVLFASSLFAFVVSKADWSRVQQLVATVGAIGFGLLLLPQLIALSAESFGWKLAFRVLGRDVRFSALLRVRLSTEALAQSLPFGVAFAESMKPPLLRRHAGVPVTDSIAGMAARKYLLLLSQSFYVLALGTLGFAGLQAASHQTIGTRGLGVITLGMGAVLAGMALAVALSLRNSGIARGALGWLRRIPVGPLRRWLGERERTFSATDTAVSSYFRAPLRRSIAPAACFLGAWLIEAIETYLILRALGVEAGFLTLASVEIVLCIVRNLAFMLPAGLGVQDLGYVALLAALGVPDAASVGAAFVLVKRSKELFWILFGYWLLLMDWGRRHRAHSEQLEFPQRGESPVCVQG
jgi:glycosyltransferase 2 family protein